jgi:hypothetical protein
MAEKRDMMLINETSARVDGLSREASAARRTIREDPDDFSHCPDINPEIRLKFLVAPFVSETVPATVN